MAIELTLELALGLIGSITGVASFLFLIRDKLLEKPILKVGDILLWLEKDNVGKIVGKLSFNINNVGERSTTISRINVILGEHVEVIEGLRDIAPHSSIRYPEKAEGEIKLFSGRKEVDTLDIIIIHTHDTTKSAHKLPQIQEWDKQALWKGGPVVLEP